MSIVLENVSVDLAGRRVLVDLSATIDERRVGVIGANGSGKSTLARLVNGLVLPSAGRVLVEGRDTRADTKAVRRKVGFVFQNPDNQIVYPIVAEDVAFGLERLGLSKAETADRVARTLSRFGLSHLAQASAHLLSGGEKQLLALAGVLAAEPDILVLDEPTTLLDLRNTRRIAGILADLPQRIVLVTHDLALLAGFDRVLVVDEGRLVADAPPDEAIAAYRALMEAP